MGVFPCFCFLTPRFACQQVDESADYIHTEGVIIFAPNEISKPIYVEICDDAEYEEDEDFYIELWELEEMPVRDIDYKPPTLKDKRIQCTILDDDHFGVFEFNKAEMEVFENAGIVSLTLLRLNNNQKSFTFCIKAFESS